MRTRTLARSYLGLALASASTLTACSGGGATPTTPAPTITPATASPTPTATPTTAPAMATGKIVDFDSNAGLPGVTVAIASYSSTAAPVPVTTTAADGTFVFTAASGTYLIEMGSNSPTDTRATYHNKVVLVSGVNSITQGVPNPMPTVSLSLAQQSGVFRLAALSSVEQSCLSGANQGRSTDGLSSLTEDESLLETSCAYVALETQEQTDNPNQTADNPFNYIDDYGGTGSSGFASCTAWTGNAYSYVQGNPPYQFATYARNVWYAASFGGSGNYGTQAWSYDPR